MCGSDQMRSKRVDESNVPKARSGPSGHVGTSGIDVANSSQ
jgi:hypothetical protein